MSCPTITRPTFEHHHSGLGVDFSKPRISWRFQSDVHTAQSWYQIGYEIEISFASSEKNPHTFEVVSSDSVLVPWPARPLASREIALVRVRTKGGSRDHRNNKADDADNTSTEYSSWSPHATVEAALLSPSDFTASFITAARPQSQESADQPVRPIRLHKTFTLPPSSPRGKARLYITALGVYEAYINGQRVGNEYMAPGWTSYKHRLAYRVHDVSSLINTEEGAENVLAIEVAEGWYAGRLGFRGGERFRYGDRIGVMAQLEVLALADVEQGAQEEKKADMIWNLSTNETWLCGPSPIITSEIYDGEVYDAREEDNYSTSDVHHWSSPHASFTRKATLNNMVQRIPFPSAKLFSPDQAPVRVTEIKSCVSISRSASGKMILDFGQNLVGVLRVKTLAPAHGQRVRFTHAEVMEHGELGTRPLKLAKCADTVIGNGHDLGPWSPKYTFHGFRYVQVDGWPGVNHQDDNAMLPNASIFEALILHTDMTRRGHFSCSNASVKQLHQNIVWSMRGNFLSLPTDCPQRDERLGWTGDAQVFAPTAGFLYDTTAILGSWLRDVAAEQLLECGQGGIPPVVVPFALGKNFEKTMAQAVWGDVVVLMPWDLYRHSGDRGLLERQFQSMRAWLDEGVARGEDGLWDDNVWQFGDWLDPSAPPEEPANGRTDPGLVANAYLVHTTRMFVKVCRLLNKDELAVENERTAARLLELFQRRYITAEGNLMSSTQTGLALAVVFDLYPFDQPHMRATAAKALDRLVRTARFTIATGFAGTPIISRALTASGLSQLAYRMLLETRCPSWLYPITMGATTTWERWDSMLPDGTINSGHMTSFNHYALGAVADWLHSTVGGISPAEAGWRVIRVRPVPGGNIRNAEVQFDGAYGLVKCQWEVKAEQQEGTREVFEMELTVPPSCTALVTLPCDIKPEFLQDGEGGEKTFEVGSGVHKFSQEFIAGEWPPEPWTPPFLPKPEATIAQ